MTTSLTDMEKIRRLPWLTAGDALNMGFVLLTFSGPVFLLFLNELGLDKSQIGFMLSLVPFCGIIAPFITPLVARYGYKRVYITFWGGRKFILALLLLTPAFIARFGASLAFFWVAGIIFVFALCRAIAETGGYPWRKEAVPDSIRGKFTAINNMLATLTGIIVISIASYVIDLGTGLNRFMILLGAGIIVGFISVWCYAQVPGGAPVPSNPQQSGHLKLMKLTLYDRDFMLFLAALGLATFGGTAVISFIPLFMKQEVGLSEGNVVLLSIGTYAGAVASSYLWGWLADRYGSKPIMQTNLILMLFLPAAWFLMPRHSPLSLPLAMTVAVLVGISTLGWQISWMRYLFVNAMPAENKSAYTAVYYAWFGLVSGLAPLLAGQILDLSETLQAQFLIFTIDAYTPLFALSVILLIAGQFTVIQLRSVDATPFRRFAGMFLRGNSIRALESMIMYNYSTDEMTRMVTTERMGDARNALSTNELIEALNDPSFNVRYEAIHAIGRMPPEPELVTALIDLLEQGESELSFVVIRSLGKLGDPKAIKPLRQMLFSGYHLLEASSARALAMLGDQESIPCFLEKFRSEQSDVLRLAYVSALGKLQVVEAIGELFGLLRRTEVEVLRGEIGLALARIAGDERYYMQHWHSMRANPATVTAQAILALQKSMKSAHVEVEISLTEACAHQFARGDVGEGSKLLKKMIQQLPHERLNPAQVQILEECGRALSEPGETRLEFILLSLHTLNEVLQQQPIRTDLIPVLR